MQSLSVLTNGANISQRAAADVVNLDVQNNNNNDSLGVRRTSSFRRLSSRRRARSLATDAHSMFARLILKTVIHEEEEDEDQSFYLILKHAIEQEALLAHQEGDVEDDRQLSREELLEKIRKKKAVIERLRCQAWPMRRKRRTLTLAQKYLQRHEAKVSKVHLLKEEFKRKWKKFKRWLVNISIYLIPWEAKIKTIESHFGSVVSSYFTFLRWIFWVNMIMTLFMVSFIVIPECLADAFADEERRNHSDTTKRKHIDEEDAESALYLQTVWDYKGYLSASPLFYGYYSNKDYILTNFKYQLPLAYFLVNICTLGYSFFAILRKMASNTRLSKSTGGKTEQYPFAWKLFTGWDYSIGNAETTANTVMANANKLREAIMEYKTKQKQKFAWIRLMFRFLANILILCMIAGSAYAIYAVVEQSKLHLNPTAFEQNQVAIVVSFITLVFPNFFELISRALEGFHPRTALRLHLGRILALYLLNFYTLIIALLTKINALRAEQEALLNATTSPSVAALAAATTELTTSAETTQVTLLEESGRFLRHLALDQNSSGLANESHFLHLASILAAGLASVAATNFTFLSTTVSTSSSPVSVPSSSSAWLFLPSASPATSSLPPSPPLASRSARIPSNLAHILLGSTLAHTRMKRQNDEALPLPSTTTEAAVTATTAFHGPLLWAIVHPDVGTVGVNKAKAYIETGTTVPPPSVSRVTSGPITQRERQLQRLCWETWVGQEIAKLITMDLVMTIVSVLMVDFFRGLWVRYCHRWWFCWNLESAFPEYGEFKVAENVLHIINNQGMIWLGLFFCPLLPAVNNAKLVILMYVRGWAVMTCNVPATQVFRASRSGNFYLLLLLLMLFLCTLPVGFLIASYRPSTTCGPFSSIDRFYHIVTNRLESQVPSEIYGYVNMIASPGIIIPVLLMLALIIYFLISLVRGLREANQDLQKQLIHERTEEKRKIYRLAGGGKQHERGQPHRSSISLPETRKVDTSYLPLIEQRRREAWRTRLALDDDRSGSGEGDDDTDTPPSEYSSPAVKKKRSFRQLLTPVLGERELVPSLTPETATRDKKEENVAFQLYDEEEDDKLNLTKRWKGDTRMKAKTPPLASMDTLDDTLLRSSTVDSSISDMPSLLTYPRNGPSTVQTTSSAPGYRPVSGSSAAVVPKIVKHSPPAASLASSSRFPQPVSTKSLLTPAQPSPSKGTTGSSRSSPGVQERPSVVLASSGNKDYQRWKLEKPTTKPEAATYSRLRVGGVEADTAKPPRSRLRTATASGHFRSNIADEDDEAMDKLLTLPELLQKLPPAQRKFQKSVSSTFLPWSASGAGHSKHGSQPPRKISLTHDPAPAPASLPPRANKFTISVSSPDNRQVGDENGGKTGPAVGKRYIIRQSPAPRPEPTPKKGRVSLASSGTPPAKLTVVSEVSVPPTSAGRGLSTVKKGTPQPTVSQATAGPSTGTSKATDLQKHPQGPATVSLTQPEAKGGPRTGPVSRPCQYSSERRPSVEHGGQAKPVLHATSERRPPADHGGLAISDRRTSDDRGGQSKPAASEQRPPADRGGRAKAVHYHGASEPKPSMEYSGQTKLVRFTPATGSGQASTSGAFPPIRPPPSARPAYAVQQFRDSQTSLASQQTGRYAPRGDSLEQQKP